LADDVTAASAHLPPPLLPAHFWPHRPLLLPAATAITVGPFLARDRCAWLALLGRTQSCLESRYWFRSRGGAVVARVAVQLLARSNRHAGCMTCGPGPPCWVRWNRRGAPTWHGCMSTAWLSALSLAGLGESGGMLVTAGSCMHRAWRFGFFRPGPACMTRGTQPPCRRGRTLERVGEDSARDGWGRRWKESPLKGG
jgi:hypothetical protein